MARRPLICILSLLFTLLTQMLSTEGRDIKSSPMKIAPQKTSMDIPQTVTYDNNFPSIEPTHTIPLNNFKVSSLQKNKVESKRQGDIPNPKSLAHYRLNAPGHRNMHPTHAKKDSKKPNKSIPSRSSTSKSFSSAFAMVSDFRPTAPGTSPGAGHAGINKNDKEESRHCLNDKCTEEFQPTAPGDSPGAGHFFVNRDNKALEEGKRYGVAYTLAAQSDAYRSTGPGQSPGAGHPVLKETAKLRS